MSKVSKTEDVIVVLAAAGQARRFRESQSSDTNQNKIFLELYGEPIWQICIRKLRQVSSIGRIYMTVAHTEHDFLRSTFGEYLALNNVELVIGGHERWASVANALVAINKAEGHSGSNIFVAIHDAARPCFSRESITRVIEKARESGAAILGQPLWGTIKRVDATDRITETVSRENLFQATTPQVFRLDWLVEAFAEKNIQAELRRGAITDDAQLIAAAGFAVTLVKDDPCNIKITTREDLELANFFASRTR